MFCFYCLDVLKHYKFIDFQICNVLTIDTSGQQKQNMDVFENNIIGNKTFPDKFNLLIKIKHIYIRK